MKLIGGTVIGGTLMFLWWSEYGSDITALSGVDWTWLALALLGLGMSLGLQLVRTHLLIRPASMRRIAAPVLLAHGLNVLAPSLLGDLYEIGALARSERRPVREILGRLLHRLSTTLAALGLLAGLALGSVDPNLGFVLISASLAVPLMVDGSTHLWSPRLRVPSTDPIAALKPLGLGPTLLHIALSTLQHSLSAAAVFLLGAAIGDPVSPPTAAGMLSLADLVTYLPIPLGGVGVHHWGVSSMAEILGSVPAQLVVVNHALAVLVGGLCAAAGWSLTGDNGPSSWQNE
jgi:uncharacterized membrane protein YbhN (UPF0104 family)